MDADSVLRDGGWRPGPVVDLEAAMASLMKDGFRLFPAAVACLREFDGLQLRGDPVLQRHVLWIDAAQATRSADAAWCQAYAEAEGVAMVPVGGYSHMSVFVDERGCYWGGFDDLYGPKGDTFRELVHNLLLDPEFVPLDREVGGVADWSG